MGGRSLSIREVCMDFEPYFKVHNLVSFYPKNMKLGQMTNLNVIFDVIVAVKLAPVPCWILEWPIINEFENWKLITERRFGTWWDWERTAPHSVIMQMLTVAGVTNDVLAISAA